MAKLIKTPKEIQMEMVTGKKSLQHCFNSILWEMVDQKGGSVEIDLQHLRNLPDSLTLGATVVGDKLVVESKLLTGKFQTAGKLEISNGG